MTLQEKLSLTLIFWNTTAKTKQLLANRLNLDKKHELGITSILKHIYIKKQFPLLETVVKNFVFWQVFQAWYFEQIKKKVNKQYQFQQRKHELATSIQSVYKGYVTRVKYQKMRAAVTIISSHWRRVLATRLKVKRKKAALDIRKYINL